MHRLHLDYLHSHSIQASSGSSFWGAFWGAFLAFIFGLVTYIITKRRERFVLHKNALVKLERSLNKHLDDFFILSTVLSGIRNDLENERISVNRLFTLRFPEGLDMEIGSLDLVNRFFAYQVDIDRVNLDIATFNRALDNIENSLIRKLVPQPENFQFIKELVDTFLKEIPEIDEKNKLFLVLTRIHYSRIKDRCSFTYGIFNTQWEHDISQTDIEKEREKLETEIKSVMTKKT